MSEQSEVGQPEEGGISVGNYVVGLFDVLGQKEILREWQGIFRGAKTPEDRDRLREQMRLTYGVVSAFRKDFKSAFRVGQPRPAPPEPLNAEDEAEWQVLTSNPLKMFGFSDTVVGFVSMSSAITKLPITAVYGMLAATGMVQIVQLAREHPVRGGIECGLAFEIDDDEVYGPTLMRAYGLENEVAQYPRVVVGDGLTRFISAAKSVTGTDAAAEITRRLANKMDDFLCEDTDGNVIVDFLGTGIRALRTREMKMSDLIAKAADFVQRCNEKYKSERNTKLAFRYSHLHDYFAARLDEWDMNEANIPTSAERLAAIRASNLSGKP